MFYEEMTRTYFLYVKSRLCDIPITRQGEGNEWERWFCCMLEVTFYPLSKSFQEKKLGMWIIRIVIKLC